jgi:hypothetical protein
MFLYFTARNRFKAANVRPRALLQRPTPMPTEN